MNRNAARTSAPAGPERTLGAAGVFVGLYLVITSEPPAARRIASDEDLGDEKGGVGGKPLLAEAGGA